MACDHSYKGGPFGESIDDIEDREEERARERLFEILDRISDEQAHENWLRSIGALPKRVIDK